MNKTKKIAMMVVSLVMAGSMALTVAACGGGDNAGTNPGGTTTPGGDTTTPGGNTEGNGNGSTDGNGNTNTVTTTGADSKYYVSPNKTVTTANKDYIFAKLTGGISYVPSSATDVISYLNDKGMSNFEQIMRQSWINLFNYYRYGVTSTTTSQQKLPIGTSGEGQTIRMNVCDGDNPQRQVAYTNGQISNVITGLDGKRYTADSSLVKDDISMIKPAWREISERLNIKFSNVAQGKKSDAQIKDDLQNIRSDSYDIVTASVDAIVQQAKSQSDTFLDLSLYLDEMPNYKAFLEENPIVKLSLVSDASTGSMYYAPYFDGNDDIEKYEIINKNWVSALLGDTTATSTVTYKEHAESKANTSAAQGYTDAYSPVTTETAVTSYMGNTDWSIEVTDPSDVTSTKLVYVQYSKALAAVKDESTVLGKAYKAAAGSAYTGENGNIIDIMNEVINDKAGEVEGKDLLNILRAYIDVAYTDKDGNSYYSNRADVFNGQDAAWDVDLFVALSRCLVTNVDILPAATKAGDKVDMSKIYAISGRANTNQRNSDIYGLAGELYGVRGLTPRYQFTYIDNNGFINDARLNEDAWDAMSNMHALLAEGLLHLTDEVNTKNNPTEYAAGLGQTLMEYDYVQTQTQQGFTDGTDLYNYAPIVTPVSKWDVDGDSSNGHEVTMRFTESWRTVKNTGICVPYSSVVNNPNKLKAILTMIDYLYSNDGQIVSTYGPQASGADALDGYWYATEVKNVKLEDVAYKVEGSTQYTVKSEYASQYFIFDNKVYTGTAYNGGQIPTLTNATLALFKGESVTNAAGQTLKVNDSSSYNLNWKKSYTDFARGVIGAALPLGNKNQGFEYQCSAECGLAGAAIVSNALANGTIKHTTQTIDTKSLWYTLVPSALPYSATDADKIKNDYNDIQSNLFDSSSAATTNAWLDVIYYGYGYNK
jgi:putative aldouronate transport system substrate-binding protein